MWQVNIYANHEGSVEGAERLQRCNFTRWIRVEKQKWKKVLCLKPRTFIWGKDAVGALKRLKD